MPSISRKRTRKNRALKRTRKINSRRIRHNSRGGGGIFGSIGKRFSGIYKTIKNKAPRISSEKFKALRSKLPSLSRKKKANNANAPLLNAKKESNPSSNPLANASPSNSAGNSNANKGKNSKGNQPTNGNQANNGRGNQANNGKAKQPSNGKAKQTNNGRGNQAANGNGNQPVNGTQPNKVPPANTPVNANKATPPTNNGANGQK